jgi:hypothetical protein
MPGLKELPPSRERSSLKSRSILKPSKPTSDRSSHSAHNFKSLGEMLEWALKSLAKDEMEQRLDAYCSLLTTLQAYDGLPDTNNLNEKFRLLLHFIRRDMAAVDRSKDPPVPDVHLITKSMKLLMCLLRLPELREAVDTEESASIMDYSLSVLQGAEISKTMANHHLEFLAQQKFGPHIMTPDRTLRILSALRTIDERVLGNNVVARRLMIYQRLVEQIPAVMALKLAEWLDHVFHAMLSSVRELRETAIKFGISASVKLGGKKEASKAMIDLLNRSVGEETYCKFLMDRLEENLDIPEYKPLAPTIWSVPILFLRATRPSTLSKPLLRAILSLPQTCLNRTDRADPKQILKCYTFRSWCRLIFAENLSLSTLPHFRKALRTPVEQQLKRQKDGDFSQNLAQTALSSYCTLLYYALRPDASYAHLDLYWDEYVFQIMSDLCSQSRNHAELGSSILMSLFESEAVWNEQRANEEPWNVGIDDLPRLDSQWVRSRLATILKLVRLFVEAPPRVDGTSNPPTTTRTVSTNLLDANPLWTALLTSVADAGNIEITPSMELKSAVASITTLLSRVWASYSRSDSSTKLTLPTFGRLVETAMDKLGAVIFTDKILVRNSEDNNFEAASTPSHRNRAGGPLQSPALHLIRMMSASYLCDVVPNQRSSISDELLPQDFSSLDDAIPGNTVLQGLISLIATRCWRSRTSRNAKLGLILDLAEVMIDSLGTQSSADVSCTPSSKLDPLFSTLLDLALRTMSEVNSLSGQHAQVGQDYKLLLKILTLALRHTKSLFSSMEKLYLQSVSMAKREAGEGGVLLAITEPHAEMLAGYQVSHMAQSANVVRYAGLVLREDIRPKNRRVIEQSRRSLWGGVTSPVVKTADLEYTHLYPMMSKTFNVVYDSLDSSESSVEIAQNFIGAVTEYLTRSSTPQGVVLRQIQDGMMILLRDKSKRIFGLNERKRLSAKVWIDFSL